MARFGRNMRKRFNNFRQNRRFRRQGRRSFKGGGSGSLRGFINTPFRIIKRPLGRSSGRSWFGISVAGWALIGVLLYMFVKPVKNWINNLIHK